MLEYLLIIYSSTNSDLLKFEFANLADAYAKAREFKGFGSESAIYDSCNLIVDMLDLSKNQ